jgi:hypothetical protein
MNIDTLLGIMDLWLVFDGAPATRGVVTRRIVNCEEKEEFFFS